MIQNRNSITSLVLAAAVATIYFLMVFQFRAPILEADSQSYIDFSAQVLDGSVLSREAPETVSIARATRTPGYPVLLAAAKKIFGGDGGEYLILHTLIGAAALLLFSLFLKRELAPPIAAAIALIGFYDMRGYFAVVLTEWVAIALLIVLFGAMVWMLRTRAIFLNAVLGLLAGYIALTRPALMGVLFVVGLGILLIRQPMAAKLSGLAAVAVLPIFKKFWCGATFQSAGKDRIWYGNRFQTSKNVSKIYGRERKLRMALV